jgi:hypothetical protein
VSFDIAGVPLAPAALWFVYKSLWRGLWGAVHARVAGGTPLACRCARVEKPTRRPALRSCARQHRAPLRPCAGAAGHATYSPFLSGPGLQPGPRSLRLFGAWRGRATTWLIGAASIALVQAPSRGSV